MDKKNGNILSQGDEQEESSLLTNLTLSTVKECDIEEADRNFCFQVRLPPVYGGMIRSFLNRGYSLFV